MTAPKKVKHFYCPVCRNKVTVTIYDAKDEGVVIAECTNRHKKVTMVDAFEREDDDES